MGMNENVVVTGTKLSDLPLTSEQSDKMLPALFTARKTIKKAAKNAENPDVGSVYADFNACMDAVEAPLMEQSIMVEFFPRSHVKDGILEVMCQITHESGQFRRAVLACSTAMDPQSVGSATTYLKRYTLSALTGLKTEDDDGNTATRNTKGRVGVDHGKASGKAKTEDKAYTPRPATESQQKYLKELAAEKGAEIPDGVLGDSKKASAFIDELKGMKNPVSVTVVSDTPAEPATTTAPALAEVVEEAPAPASEPEVEAPKAKAAIANPSAAYTKLSTQWAAPAASKEKAESRVQFVKRQAKGGTLTEEEVARLLQDCCQFNG